MKILITYYNGSSFYFDNFVRLFIKDYAAFVSIRKFSGSLDVIRFDLKDVKKIETSKDI